MVWRHGRRSAYGPFWGRYHSQFAPQFRRIWHGDLNRPNYVEGAPNARYRRASRMRSAIMRYRQRSGIRPMGPRRTWFNADGSNRLFHPQIMRQGRRMRSQRHSAPAA